MTFETLVRVARNRWRIRPRWRRALIWMQMHRRRAFVWARARWRRALVWTRAHRRGLVGLAALAWLNGLIVSLVWLALALYR